MVDFSAGANSNAVTQANKNATSVAAMQQAGNAYDDYRQFSRDNYQNQLGNESANYQGVMNMLGSSGGGIPNTQGLNAEDNPLSMAQTGVGSTAGSNYAGGTWKPGGTTDRSQWQNTVGIGGGIGNAGYPADPKTVAAGGYGNVRYGGPQNNAPGGVNNINTAPMSQSPNGPYVPPQGQQAPGQGFNFSPRRGP